MNERGTRRGGAGTGGGGAPFYVPLRRQTSAEIISEARAAVYGEMSGALSGAGALRPLRTRRPFTPREPQRVLFAERSRAKEQRPPSSFDLKHLSLLENGEDSLKNHEEQHANGSLKTFTQNKKKRQVPEFQTHARSIQERSGDGWSLLPKLPHLSGRSKPLHRRNTISPSPEDPINDEHGLANAISIIQPLGGYGGSKISNNWTKSVNVDSATKKRQLTKSVSCDATNGVGKISVRHIEVQLPNTGNEYKNMSLLEIAESLIQKSRDLDRNLLLMEALINAVEKHCPTGSMRELTLRALYLHIDSDDERILVSIARAMLTMRVTSHHLAAVCKIVFKIAKNDKNDHFFRNTNLLELLVEGCGRADPISEGECCVYGAGALRFLALDPRLCTLAHNAGALHLAALHLKLLNNAKSENSRAVSEHSTHAMYQLTGALRNLAGAGAGQKEIREFVVSGALGELVAALTCHTDRDVLTNVARCLSVLSAEESCCAWLCASSVSARSLTRALAACASRPPLAVRLAYTLGNMAAADEQARVNIFNEDGGVDVLLTILESYTKRSSNEKGLDIDPDVHLVGNDLLGSDGSNEDVLIKTVRVVANLCLAESVGRGLAAIYADRILKALLDCLEMAKRSDPMMGITPEKQTSSCERKEELATAALATLNNVTFYREPPEPPDDMDDTLDQICKVTCRWLGGCGGASCEAVRALGNLSRASCTAQLIVLEGALDYLSPFLMHVDTSVRYAAAGVLVNVCGAGVDCVRAAELAATALSRAATDGDSQTAALLARALWNAHAHSPLTASHSYRAMTALNLFIDDDSVFEVCKAATSRTSDRRASDPDISTLHVKLASENNNMPSVYSKKLFQKSHSMDQNLHLKEPFGFDEEEKTFSGEDQGFEEGDLLGEECDCGPCRRLASWEELVGVAIPLLEKLRPPKNDASCGTD